MNSDVTVCSHVEAGPFKGAAVCLNLTGSNTKDIILARASRIRAGAYLKGNVFIADLEVVTKRSSVGIGKYGVLCFIIVFIYGELAALREKCPAACVKRAAIDHNSSIRSLKGKEIIAILIIKATAVHGKGQVLTAKDKHVCIRGTGLDRIVKHVIVNKRTAVNGNCYATLDCIKDTSCLKGTAVNGQGSAIGITGVNDECLINGIGNVNIAYSKVTALDGNGGVRCAVSIDQSALNSYVKHSFGCGGCKLNACSARKMNKITPGVFKATAGDLQRADFCTKEALCITRVSAACYFNNSALTLNVKERTGGNVCGDITVSKNKLTARDHSQHCFSRVVPTVQRNCNVVIRNGKGKHFGLGLKLYEQVGIFNKDAVLQSTEGYNGCRGDKGHKHLLVFFKRTSPCLCKLIRTCVTCTPADNVEMRTCACPSSGIKECLGIEIVGSACTHIDLNIAGSTCGGER